MKIFIDADACPVVSIIEQCALDYDFDCIIVCDHNHLITSDISKVIMVDTGFDSADFVILNKASAHDVLVTQDYGLASLALSKKIRCMNPFGMEYTEDNINSLLTMRHYSRKARDAKIRTKGPKKRLVEDDLKFESSFRALLESML